MHNIKSFMDFVTRKHMKAISMWQGVQYFILRIWTEISHSLGLQKSNNWDIWVDKMVV